MPPDVPPSPQDITVTATTHAPVLIAFRDGFAGGFTTVAAGTSKFTVNGAYTAVVVCKQADGTWLTWEHADFPDAEDETTIKLTPPCDDVAPTTHTVTGTLTGAGTATATVTLGGGLEATAVAGAFSIPGVPAGKYDVGVRTADSFGISSHAVIEVTDASPATVDAGAGTATLATLVSPPTPFTPANPKSAALIASNEAGVSDVEIFTVTTLIKTKNSPSPMKVFTASSDPTAAKDKRTTVNGKVLATAPANTTQQITMTAKRLDPLQPVDNKVADAGNPIDAANSEILERSTNRDFDGKTTKITLPTGYGTVVWNTNQDPSGPSFIADSEAPDIQTVILTGTAGDGSPALNVLEILASYAAATNVSRFVVETDITGYKADWKLDTSKPDYTRSTESEIRVDDKGTDPETHDNRAFSSTQSPNATGAP